MLIFFEAIHLYVSLALLAIVLIVLGIQKKSLSYLFFFAIFGIYIIGVVSVVIFPIHIPDGNAEFVRRLQVNLVPLYFGGCYYLPLCLKNIYLNILLTIPFGFGISFVAKVKPKDVIWVALAVGLVFEFSQLIVSLVFRSPFRVVDVNDVILNAVGVWLGYALFRIFGFLYLFVTKRFEMRHRFLFAYVYEVVRQSW